MKIRFLRLIALVLTAAVLLSGCGIVVLSPVLLGVALAVKLESPAPSCSSRSE